MSTSALSDPSSVTPGASTSSSSIHNSFNKRLRHADPSLTSLCSMLAVAEMSITRGESNSSSPTSKSFKYDVFLSFWGEDTPNNNFVGHLYEALQGNCIETYMDDQKIIKGDMINDQLLKSIEESRFYIIVFSKNYASSSWCLDELVKIIECQKMTEHTAYPVFFDVEPTEVRKQYGPVGEAFSKHENKEAVGKWREAMKELADLAGWELKVTSNGDESKSIKIIVDAIFKKLHSTNSTADGKLVGMETRDGDVLSSLEIGTEDVHMRMGSWRKTTLAGVYDRISNHFEGKSFVEKVREISKPSLAGLKKLRKQEISFTGLHERTGKLIAMKRRRKILVKMPFNKRLRLSDPSSITPGASISSSSIEKRFKYDVFISFRGEDTRNNFVGHLYEALQAKCIGTYKDDEKMKQGETIDNQLIQAIKDSRFFIIVFSKNYASSSWCLDELVEIMECQKTREQTAYPVFFDVEPTQVRNQSGAFGEAFLKNQNKDAAGRWIEALKGASNLVGRELQATTNGHQAKFVKKIVQEISLELRSINFGFDEKLVGMETRVKDLVSSLELEVGIDEVRMIGIKGMGGSGKTTTARAVFDHLSDDFEAKSFIENVREVSKASMFGLKNLQEQVLSKLLNEHVTLESVNDGKNIMKRRMCDKKVLLVLDDVDHIEQLKALAGEPKWFKPGSRILITTRDEQVLVAHRVNVIRDIVLLSNQEAISLFSRYAFGSENPPQGYEEMSRKVLCYAAGLPLTVEVLGSFLCGKDMDEWVDAIDRLNNIPLKETLEKLELSYIGLEDDYKEIFLDIACVLKGKRRENAIRVLECCGFHARNGLKVLEQRSLITISKRGYLRMHDHIEEMAKNIVRRSHPDEPNKHSRLWIGEEIGDILANDMGTEETRCLKLNTSKENARTVMKGLGKMKKLRYLEVNFAYNDVECLDDTSQYFPNSLKHLKCSDYPFLYLPKTFEANNLVGLDMKGSAMVQLWEEGEKKVLKKLKFLSLSQSNLMTFDIRITPNLHTLSLGNCAHFVELHMSVACPNLKFLDLRKSRLRSLDLELIPNLERLSLQECHELVEINAPVGCLKKVIYLNLSGCLMFTYFKFGRHSEPKVSCSSATLALVSQSIEVCPLHPSNNLKKFRFLCSYGEESPSPVGNIEKLISFGPCVCIDFRKFSDIICTLQCLKKLTLKCDIPEFPKDLGRLECLEELRLSSTKIKHLPDSICMLKHLKYLEVGNCALLEKLPEDLGQLECLEKLYVRSKTIKFLPDSICMLKHLKRLYVTGCCRLGKLPEDIGQIESLERLDLSCTMIKHLPDSITMLKHLNYLNLQECALLEKLPEDIGLLECLKVLVLTHTRICYLPKSIFGLKDMLIAAPRELLQRYEFPPDITTTTPWPVWCSSEPISGEIYGFRFAGTETEYQD